MYSVYVAKSDSENWYYVGISNNVSKRIVQHNRGQTRSTRLHAPLTIVFQKDFPDRITARDYEKFLKIHSNKEKLIKSLT